jgi:3-deoxy-7-phosphoheptulonate synthase
MEKPIIIAGPCAIESEEQALSIAKKLKNLGIKYFRGGAFKPRTNPNDFQGLGQEGLKILEKVKKELGMKIVTEILNQDTIHEISKIADIIQIGSRNMQNYELLKKIAQECPNCNVILKRGFQSNLKEIKGAIAYLENYGLKGEILFCERGIRTFANNEYSRFTLDTNIVTALKKMDFKYKIIVDPSHTAGNKDYVENLSYTGIASGADGLIIEVKLNDCKALCDDAQAITIEQLKRIIDKSKQIYNIINNY